jgi:hypothetical protein
MPGVRSALLVMVLYVLAHNVLYTYIEPLAVEAGAGPWLDRLLLAFGVAAIAGIGIAGWGVDRHLRAGVGGGDRLHRAGAGAAGGPAWPARCCWRRSCGAWRSARCRPCSRPHWHARRGRCGSGAVDAGDRLEPGHRRRRRGGGVLLQASGPSQLGWLPLLLLAVTAAWLLARPKAWA